jgi:PAS domain S-box-containing protein
MPLTLSIRTKLFLAIVSILALSYAILLYVTIRHVNASLEQKMNEDLEANLRYAQGQYLAHANEIRSILQAPALFPQLHESILKRDRAALERSMVQWKENLPSVDILLVVGSDRVALAQITGKPCTPGCLRLFDVFDAAAQRRLPVIATEVVPTKLICDEFKDLCPPSGEGETMLLVVAVPVLDAAHRFLGCIVACDIVNQDTQIPYRAKQIFGKEVEIAISLKGKRIASTLHSDNDAPVQLPAAVIKRLEQGLPYRGEATIQGKIYKTAIEPITNQRGEFIGALSVALSREDFNNIRVDNLRNIIVSGVVGIILSFGMAFFVARGLTRPLKALLAGVRDLEEGRPPAPLATSMATSDEFAVLAGSFNMMLGALQDRDREISHKTKALEKANLQLVEFNAELGRRVNERTADLKIEMGRLEAILTSLTEGVIVTDRENRVILFNPAAQKLFNVLPYRLIGRPFDALCDTGEFCVLRQFIQEMEAAPERTSRDAEVAVGDKRLKVNMAPLSDESGEFAGVVMSLRDVTLEGEVDRIKSEFISTVSHELKTPLTSMQGSLDFILEKGEHLSDTERELLNICRRNTSRLMRLISDILDLTKIESGRMQFSLKPTSLQELVTSSIEELTGFAANRLISIRNEIPDGLPPAFVDGDRLIQVITNLLANAIKFSPEGESVTISAECSGSHLTVSVSDNGRPISGPDRERLFRRFQQLDGSDRREHGGTGLGLAICKEIVEQHHGRIFYRPGEGGGNLFTFTVPVYGEEA